MADKAKTTMTTKDKANMAIRAVNKVRPSYADVQMDSRKQEEYDKWLKVVRWLETFLKAK